MLYDDEFQDDDELLTDIPEDEEVEGEDDLDAVEEEDEEETY